MNSQRYTPFVGLALFLTLSACADFGGDYEPILDGPEGATYQVDLESCQHLALEQPSELDIYGSALAGGLVFGLAGSESGYVGSAEAAAIGTLFGLVGGLFDVAEHRKNIILRCMEGRGHLVVG
ncbi:MAG: glycine zipper family protein [Pseudomonadota bacterium]